MRLPKTLLSNKNNSIKAIFTGVENGNIPVRAGRGTLTPTFPSILQRYVSDRPKNHGPVNDIMFC